MKAIRRVQQRVPPRLKECAICRKPVTKADFDGKGPEGSQPAVRHAGKGA